MEQSKMNYRSIALSVIVSVFIGIIGFSFAYFTVGVTGSGGGSSATASSANLSNAELTATALAGSNNAIYPGIMNWRGVSVKASKKTPTASGTYTVSYEFTATVTASAAFGTPIKYSVYEATTSVAAPITCQDVTHTGTTSQQYTRPCTLDTTTLSKLSAVKSGTITSPATSGSVKVTGSIEANGTATKYYYLIVEYPNTTSDQSGDMGKTITSAISNVTATNLAIS